MAWAMPVPFSGCWVWMGSMFSRNGYGRVWWDGRRRQAHRVLWEMANGPVPRGMVLDHRCRVRCCVNPAHLEPVTVRVNTLRGAAVLFKVKP